jgi:hypothetical protein
MVMMIPLCKKILLVGIFLVLVTAFAAYYFLPRVDTDDMRMVELVRILQLPRKDIEDMSMEEYLHIMQARAQRIRIRLLYRTDHKSLLLACRELSKKKAAGVLESQMYNVLFDPHPESSKFPAAILELEPNYVFVDNDGRIMVEMLGGLDHFGVNAYPEDYKKSSDAEKLGDKKLLDGLWYYDDGYLAHPEDYDKQIESLRPKSGQN